MKLLNDLEGESAPLFAGTLCDSSLSSTGLKTSEYSVCRNLAPVTSAGTTDTTSVSIIGTTVVTDDTVTEQYKSEKNTFAPIFNDIPTRKITLASSDLALSRSASDSKLCIGSQPKLGLVDIQSYDARCKGFDELSRVTADIAAENPDMIRFQQVLNSWVSLFLRKILF